MPLSFEPNRGQTSDAVQWVARGPEYALFLSGHDAVLELNSIAAKKGMTDRPKIESAAVRMNLLGAKPVKTTEGEEPQAGKANYFTGRDQAKWLSGVPMFGKVRLREVYPGIDLVYYGRQGRLEYDFVVEPGADPAKIALGFEGAKAGLGSNGDLVLPIAGEGWAGEKEIRFDKPAVYQMKDGVREPVAGGFHVATDGRVSFALGEYDRSRELVIDPTLVFEGEIGTGNQQTIPTGMTVDSAGEMVITGYTNDLTFPTTTGAYQTTCSSPTDPFVENGMTRCGASSAPSAFVTKLSADGTTLLYSTYLHGGGGYEQGSAVVTDSAGDAYVLGSTSSNDFPITSNAYQTLCQPYAAGQNGALAAECDNFSNGGGTEYTVNGPTLFIAELNPQGTGLLYSTFFGGSNAVYPVGLALDSAGNMVFASSVNGAPTAANAYPNSQLIQFPVTTNAYQTAGIGVLTPAVSKLSADGQTLIYSTFVGSPNVNVGHNSNNQAFALGQNGIAYIGGFTQTADFPTTAGSVKPACTPEANDSSYCQTNMGFVAAIDTTKSGASSLVYASYLGGETTQGSNIPEQQVYGLAADANNDLFVTGYTYAVNFPTTTGGFQTSCPVQGNSGSCPETAFLTKINPSGSALTWSTFVGGTGTSPASSYGNAIALDGQGQVYLYGFSQDGGGDFPQVNPLQSYSGGNKVFVTEFTADGSTELFGTRFGTSSTTSGSGTTPIANGIAVDAAGNMYIVGYTNDNGTFGTTPGTYSTPATNGFNRTFFAKISPATTPVPANGITTNLLLNPGAELGSIADWTPGGDGTPTVDQGTFDPGINPHSGSYDFLGQSGAADSLSQTVSILQQGLTAAQVDSNTLFASVSFWEQGLNQGTPSDDGSVTVTFLNASSAAISSMTTATVDSHDGTWANGTGLFAIPAGTRSITYTMNFMRNRGSDNDSFIDDNSLTIVADTGLTVSPAVLHFGNVAVGQTSAPQTATLTNQQASGTTINLSGIVSELGSNPSNFVQTNNCPAALTAGASCTVTVTFAPGGVGAESAGIAIFDDATPGQQQIAVDGTGTGGILQVNPGNLKTIAGNGTYGYSGDGGPAVMAELEQPNGMAFDPSGNFYIADSPANVIRKVDTTGKITTFAGDGTGGFAGDGGPATAAELLFPDSVTSDANGNIYIQDTGNSVIRKVDATGKITTIAGTPGVNGHAGDGGPATAATFNQNQGARFDAAGNFYVPQCDGASIRRIDTSGNISTVAGNFTEGFSGDGGPATAAQLQCPSGVTIDAAGNFYIADEFNQVIRKVTAATGIITTIAGTPGVAGATGDGGAATAATFNDPNDVVIDAAGNLYVADSGNNRVRKIDTNGIITTAAGGLNSAGSAAVNTPLAVTVDPAGNVYFSDSGNSAVREIFPEGTTPFPATTVGSTAAPQTVTISNIGNVAVTIPGGSFTTSGNAADFALAGGTCLAGATLAANGGACTLTITFTPTAVGQRSLTVMIADSALNSPQSFVIGGIGTAPAIVTPTITWPAPANIVYGTPLGAAQLDAVATGVNGVPVAGTFAYTPPAGTVLGVGTQGLSVAFTPTPVAYGPATAFNSITVTQFTPVITWPAPAAITTATALSSAQLDAVATDVNGNAIPGSYVYTPAAGTMLAAGTQTLSVTFTPTDTVDYTIATASVPITVAAAGCPVPGSASTMNIAYFTLAETDKDVNRFPNGLSSNYVLPALGANGLPVYNTAATASEGSITAPLDLLADNEITWWNPALNNGGPGGTSDLVATGTGVISLPYSNGSFYPPNGAGPNDANGFQTAVLTGTLTTPVAETVSFSIASDDMAFLYLDGQIACDDGGAHSAEAVPCTTTTVAAGTHTLQLFYLDLYQSAAALDFSVMTSNVVIGSSQLGFGAVSLSPAATEPVGTAQAITISVPVTFTGPVPTGAVSFALNGVSYPAPCTGSGQPSGQEICMAAVPAATIAALPGGIYPVTGSFAGDCNYAAATAQPVTLTIAIAQAQTITFGALAGTTYGAAPIALTATASSGLPVSFAVTGPATVSGATLAITGAGLVTVTASQAGNASYAAAAPVSQSFTVGRATPVITWAAPAGITFGTALSAAQLDATVAGVGAGTLAGTLVYTPAAGTVLPLGTETLSVAFTPTDAADYTTAAATQTITVVPAVTAATLTGPATTPPASQPSVTLSITNPYPLALTAEFTLTFAGSASVDDPSIQFSTGGRTYSYTVAADSTSVPPVQLQAGTDAGTITVTAKLLAAGVDVTPSGLAPLVIVVPPAVPVIAGTTVTRSGDTLTMVVKGFSNTREVSQAVFDFTAATGDAVATPTVTIPATTIFGTWYGSTESVAYGSTFTYTQIFNTSGDASTVGQVSVTLTNTAGVSAVSSSPLVPAAYAVAGCIQVRVWAR